MQIRRRRQLATLWRSTWVPKGIEGNTHGFKKEQYVGSLPLNSTSVPPQLAEKLVTDELTFVMQRVVEPAQLRAEQELRKMSEQDADPNWRLEEATRLIDEAAERSRNRRPNDGLVLDMQAALNRLRSASGCRLPTQLDGASQLRAIRDAMRDAATSIRRGSLGKPPTNDVRATAAYRAWSEISAEVGPGRDGSLLDALQQSGFVKRRAR